ncbi:MAG TPA: glycosyltransferase [Thermodesulfobacteriota bacterium]|nr:glycosyltransferase [Thermodesulfobacteriota bacterium]
MNYLILNTDYPEFLYWLYAHQPGLGQQPYEEQMRARNESLFGVADFYSSNLRKLGHEARDIHANNEWMQKVWAREQGIEVEGNSSLTQRFKSIVHRGASLGAKTPLRYLRFLVGGKVRIVDSQQKRLYDILAAQIRQYKPDILLNLSMDGISSRFLKEMKPYIRLLVGQIAAPLPQGENWGIYDLVISSLPNFVEYFRSLNVPSELNRLAFEPEILSRLGNRVGEIPVSFVGSLSRAHQARVHLIEQLCSNLEIEVWGYGVNGLPKNSPIRSRYMGSAWGIQMYQMLHASKITLNNHIGIAESYANNMRLFEATGVGTLLVTDWKENLIEIFEPGREVISYRTTEECVEMVNYYLEHEEERKAIAKAGQERTLREHTYYQRAQELADMVRKYV